MKYKILIIEDSKTFNNMLKRALSSISSEIIQAFSFMEAEEYLENDTFDFIFLDLILPDGEGDELIDMLPKKVRNRTIVLSGDDDVQKRAHLFEIGILDYFSKLNPMNLILTDIKHLISSLESNKDINVLIIDDSSFMRKKIKNILTPRSYNLFLAESAETGFEILKENKIHLILLDIELNGMSGTEFLEIIKKDNTHNHIPIIAVSGNDSPHIVARLLKHGASDFIKKPFIAEQLLLKCDLHIKNYKNVKLLKQKTKELKHAEEVKSRFLANMSHEIRTPLNAILGFIKLLKNKNIDEESNKYLNIIDNSSQTLLSILNDILDLSKIEAGKLKIEKVEFSPQEEFNNVISLFEIQATEKNIKIHREFINLPKFIKSDAIRLKQVLLNLMSNAIKFTPENKNIFVKIKYQNNNLFVSVKDEGIGLTQTQIEHIFNAFTQADDSTTRKFGGTGLGLTISSQIVNLLGGKLEVKSEYGKWSEFFFEIPVEKIENSTLNQNNSDDYINKSGKVLIVEDNKANQMFIQIILKKLNFEFEVAYNGQEAIQKFQEKRFDLILMDENMPVMNGIEATKQIRKIEKNENKHTPIIAVTANALPGDKERFLSEGFDEYLAKPIDIKLLKEVMNRFL